MSYDTVDRLHDAEDRIGALEHALRELRSSLVYHLNPEYRSPSTAEQFTRAWDNMQAVLAVRYCRCELEEEEGKEAWDLIPDTCTNDDCDCPCGHPWRERE